MPVRHPPPDTPTTHAFRADDRSNHDEAAAQDGWQRCLDRLRAHGVA